MKQQSTPTLLIFGPNSGNSVDAGCIRRLSMFLLNEVDSYPAQVVSSATVPLTIRQSTSNRDETADFS